MTYPLSFMTKKWSSFGYESSHSLRGRVSIGDRYFLLGGVYVFMRDVVRTFVSFLFFLFRNIIFLYIDLVTT